MKKFSLMLMCLFVTSPGFAVEPVDKAELEKQKQQLQQEREKILAEIEKIREERLHYQRLSEQKRREIRDAENSARKK